MATARCIERGNKCMHAPLLCSRKSSAKGKSVRRRDDGSDDDKWLISLEQVSENPCDICAKTNSVQRESVKLSAPSFSFYHPNTFSFHQILYMLIFSFAQCNWSNFWKSCYFSINWANLLFNFKLPIQLSFYCEWWIKKWRLSMKLLLFTTKMQL